MKVLLVPVADRPECVFALQTAFRLAESLAASVQGCHVRPHRHELSVGDDGRLDYDLAEAGLAELPQDLANLNSRRAQELFESAAGKHGVPVARKVKASAKPVAYWREMVGSPDRILGIVGPVSDLVIVSRPKKKASGPARAFQLAALLNTGKPVLVLPQKSVDPGKRICIAWNGSLEAARAVAAAMPLLQLANSVHIVVGESSGRPGPGKSFLQDYLTLWGVRSTATIIRGRDTNRELLEQYVKTNSDLLVMGAYSRHHLRQRILGGVTHAMLQEPKVTLFALHS